MKILIISHGFSPHINPRSFRWTTLAEYWTQHCGVEVDVVTSPAPGATSFERHGSLSIHRVGLQIPILLTGESDKAGQRRPGVFRRSLRWLYRHSWRRLMWPDYVCGWYFVGSQKARDLVARKKYDWVISVSHPFTGHLIGLAVKRAVPDLNWMLDIGDPFALLKEPAPNNLFLYKFLNLAVERKVLSLAQKISVTTKGTEELYEQTFGAAVRGKIKTIPPLLRKSIVASQANQTRGKGKRLSYLGTLYKKLRSPAPLLQIFAQLVTQFPDSGYELHFYGAINDCEDLFTPFQYLLGKSIFLNGLVPSIEAQAAIQRSDILINLGNESRFQLPSKTVECVASGKPIFNIVTTPDDSSLEFFHGYPALLTLVGEFSVQKAVVDLKYFLETSQPVDPQWIELRMKNFSIAAVSEAYFDLMKT